MIQSKILVLKIYTTNKIVTIDGWWPEPVALALVDKTGCGCATYVLMRAAQKMRDHWIESAVTREMALQINPGIIFCMLSYETIVVRSL